MRREWVVGGAAFAVFVLLIFLAMSDRLAPQDTENNRRAEIFLKRRPSGRPGLLSVAPPAPPREARTALTGEFSPDSLCRFAHPEGPGESREAYSNQLMNLLEEGNDRDPDLQLFRALHEGRWEDVASADRDFPHSPAAREIAWLARARLVSAPDGGWGGAGSTNFSKRRMRRRSTEIRFRICTGWFAGSHSQTIGRHSPLPYSSRVFLYSRPVSLVNSEKKSGKIRILMKFSSTSGKRWKFRSDSPAVSMA